MQASAQDLSTTLGSLLQGASPTGAALGQTQPLGTQGETSASDFLASLESSLQALVQGQQSPLVPFDPAQLLTSIEQYLKGQPQAAGGNGLPLDQLLASGNSDALTPQMRELLAQLRTLLSNGPTPALPQIDPAQLQLTPASTAGLPLPPTADAQAQLEQRRLLERLQAMPEVRAALSEAPDKAVSQLLAAQGAQHNSQTTAATDSQLTTLLSASTKPDLGVTPSTQGDDFAQQMAKMMELKSLNLSSSDGTLLDPQAKGGAIDAASLSAAAAAAQRQTAPLINDARPAVVQSYIQQPLHNPQWQNEFNNQVTWLARSGGNQTAEIRLNPAHMGPIEVRVVMHDDQASITFTAQHGVVRDAIEASLPRLREMFMGSGLQLANAQVSDQALNDQRQRQQQGFGNSSDGRSQNWYGDTSGEFGDLISPVTLSSTQAPSLLDRLDLYA